MVAAANTGSAGAGLMDGNLQDTYTELAWLRQALQKLDSMGAGSVSVDLDGVRRYGSDPVMAVLKRLDWYKPPVEDGLTPIHKVLSDIQQAIDDLEDLNEKVDSSWNSRLQDYSRALVTGIRDDCRDIQHEVEQMRTDVDGDEKGLAGKLGFKVTVFGGLDEFTSDLKNHASHYRAGFEYEMNQSKIVTPPGTSTSEPDFSDPATQDAAVGAFNRLKTDVETQVGRIENLQKNTKEHMKAVIDVQDV